MSINCFINFEFVLKGLDKCSTQTTNEFDHKTFGKTLFPKYKAAIIIHYGTFLCKHPPLRAQIIEKYETNNARIIAKISLGVKYFHMHVPGIWLLSLTLSYRVNPCSYQVST